MPASTTASTAVAAGELCHMLGIDFEKCRAALQRCKFNISLAAEYLV
jgi:hypothetical protein